MPTSRQQAAKAFRRMIVWIGVAAVIMVAGALTYLGMMGTLSTHSLIATVLGVFISVLLGSGLFALAFFSDKSGHDESVSSSTRRDREQGS